MVWFTEPLEIKTPEGGRSGRWRLTATSDEDGGGPYGDATHDHASAEECIECDRCQEYVSRRTGFLSPKKAEQHREDFELKEYERLRLKFEGKKGRKPIDVSLVKCIAFDCFGTIFDLKDVPKEEIADYAHYVQGENFYPYDFPESWFTLPFYEDSIEGLRRLQTKFELFTLSNAPRHLLLDRFEGTDLAISHLPGTTRKIYKPHLEAYTVIWTEERCRFVNTLMVTANETFGDLEAADQLGMQSQLVRQGKPNTIIELAELLGC